MPIFRTTYALKAFCLVLLALCCLGYGQVQADDDDDDTNSSSTAVEASGTHDVRWYQVELLVFKQKQNTSAHDEIWPKNITLTYPGHWQTLKTASEYEAATQQSAHPNTPFILLDNSHFQLDGLVRNLRANHNEILLHAAWHQPLTQHKDEVNGTNILIRGGERYDDHYELEGSITLYLQKFLHINTDLWLSRFVPIASDSSHATGWPVLPDYPPSKSALDNTVAPAAAVDGTVALDTTQAADSTVAPAMIERHYQVDEIAVDRQSRKMRSHETHYIDHPKLGVVIRFVPLDGSGATQSSRKK